MEEIWKDVVGYEDLFSVSSVGRVYSKRTNKILKQYLHTNGYYLIATKIGGRKGDNKTFKVHRLVAEAFLGLPSKEILEEVSKSVYNTVLVNHKDCDKLNNSFTNLEWCTYKQNSEHAIENSLIDYSKTTGSRNAMSLFKTEDERYSVYKEFKESGLSMRKFSKEKGFTHCVISRMIKYYES